MRASLHALWLTLLLFAGCNGVRYDPGLSAELFVYDAQFVEKPLPASPAGGPAIDSFTPPRTQVQAGGLANHLSGLTEPSATSVLLQLEGDRGYWIIGTGAATIAEPDLPTFDAELAFPRELAGPVTLRLRAVDQRGRVGPEQKLEFRASPVEAQGELVVTLSWDSEADLDLHVIDPSGAEVWAGNVNSYKEPPPGSVPVDRQAWKSGGMLDIDANGDCVQDSQRAENVAWKGGTDGGTSGLPPRGRYEVRVATASMCGAQVAHWTLEVRFKNSLLVRARGTATEMDTRYGSTLGSGVRAASFTVP